MLSSQALVSWAKSRRGVRGARRRLPSARSVPKPEPARASFASERRAFSSSAAATRAAWSSAQTCEVINDAIIVFGFAKDYGSAVRLRAQWSTTRLSHSAKRNGSDLVSARHLHVRELRRWARRNHLCAARPPHVESLRVLHVEGGSHLFARCGEGEHAEDRDCGRSS